MKILLDTHVLLWSVFEPHKLSSEAKEVIADQHNFVLVSIISLWEIAIKTSIGRLNIPESFFEQITDDSGFELLSLKPIHMNYYLRLPLHHRDPFDRLLVAQAQEAKLTFITADVSMMQYDVTLLKI